MVWPVPVMAVVEVSARLALNLNTAQVVDVVEVVGAVAVAVEAAVPKKKHTYVNNSVNACNRLYNI
jgi:hypothetical protein